MLEVQVHFLPRLQASGIYKFKLLTGVNEP